MTKLYTYSSATNDWTCLVTIRSILPVGRIDMFEQGDKSYKVERVVYKIDSEILEVYLI